MTRQKLNADKREVLGRKVKTLRRQGLVPANVFGHKVTSFPVQVDAKAFRAVFKEAGETGLVDLTVDGEVHPVLITESQIHPVTGDILHVDFHKVNLSEKVNATVPVHIIGESPAVKSGEGTLVEQIDEIEVEALPTELPDHFDIDISGLVEIDQAVYVKDITFDSKKVTIVTDPELIIAKVEAPQAEEVIEAPVAEEGETPAEVTEEAPAEESTE